MGLHRNMEKGILEIENIDGVPISESDLLAEVPSWIMRWRRWDMRCSFYQMRNNAYQQII